MPSPLRYLRQGRGPALVLQHGFLGGSAYWAAPMARFAARFDVIAPDLPGFAGSGHLPPAPGIPGFAASLVTFLDGLGVERFSLVGHSLGGMVALQTALDVPDRIERLVLYGTAAAAASKGRFETLAASIARIRAQGIDAHAERALPAWFFAGRDAPAYAMTREAGRGLTAETAAAVMAGAEGWDVSARLSEIKAPTLAICGDRDKSCPPEESLRLYRGIAGATLAIVPRAAHGVHLEYPDLFNSILADFLGA